MRRYELTDEQWACIEPRLPPQRGNGRPYRDHRTMLNAWFWILNTGSPWRDLPERFGPWKTAYNRFNRWQREGLIERILDALQIRLDADGRIDWDLWCVDGSSVLAHVAAVGAGKKGASKNPPTTHWVAAEAAGAPRFMWSLTARAHP
jgi:transposase